MSDTLFVQFFTKIYDVNPRFSGYNLYILCNGFSDTFDLCKTKGDFLWVNHSKQRNAYGKDQEQLFDNELPISKGIVFVSCFYVSQLFQVYQWAKKYPSINFIAGGPACHPKIAFYKKDNIPKNMQIMSCSVEEYFDVPNFSYPWKLEFPDGDKNLTLAYSYTIDTECYWGKCIFCSYRHVEKRKRPNLSFEFKNVDYIGNQRLNLYSPSMSASKLKNILYNLDYNKKVRYDIYIRGRENESKVLKETMQNKQGNFPQTKFLLGVDFPSQRMLDYMQKNLTIDGILHTINTIADYCNENVQIHLSFILGWNNLTYKDIRELEVFLNQLPYDKVKITFSVNLLIAKPNTYVFNTYNRKEDIYLGPFLYGFMPQLSTYQIALTKKAMEIMDTKPVTVFDYSNIREM